MVGAAPRTPGALTVAGDSLRAGVTGDLSPALVSGGGPASSVTADVGHGMAVTGDDQRFEVT